MDYYFAYTWALQIPHPYFLYIFYIVGRNTVRQNAYGEVFGHI